MGGEGEERGYREQTTVSTKIMTTHPSSSTSPTSSLSSSSSIPRSRRKKPRLFNKILPMFPYLPRYSGPLHVGTIDVEIPVSQLDSPASLDSFDIPTIKARIFYPCQGEQKKSKPVYWIPEPQWQYLEAFYSFLGASSRISKAVAYSSWFFRSTTIPASRNAPLLRPTTSSGRWPVTVFSHGLGGSRNTYSQICGSIASHGMIVVAPEHRDGSCPRTFICDEEGTNPRFIDYARISHKSSPEVLGQRSDQLRLRLTELGLLYDLLVKLDQGNKLSNLSKAEDDGHGHEVLESFKSLLEIHTPGKITWAGHSFGAATVAQLIKSVFWGKPSSPDAFKPLYDAPRDHPLVYQITPHSPLIMLDPWAFPLLDTQTSWLFDQELPCYSGPNPNGATVLAVLSDGFYKWNANLVQIKKFLSSKLDKVEEPAHIFYAKTSAHLSQSDFGLLFPWLTRIMLKVHDPDRIIRLNTRASVEVIRRAGIEVSRTSDIDMERTAPNDASTRESKQDSFSDEDILSTVADRVPGWIALDLKEKTHSGEGSNIESSPDAQPTDIVIEEEIRA